MATKEIPYTPRTDYGSGFLPPLVRAFTHSLFIIGANHNDWPMTNEQAVHEITELRRHLQGLHTIDDLLSAQTKEYLNVWKKHTDDLYAELDEGFKADPDNATIAQYKPIIKTYAEQTFGLLSALDKELAGLSDEQTDPGRLP